MHSPQPPAPRRPAAFRRITTAALLALALVFPTLVAAPAQAASGSITGVVKSKNGSNTSNLAGAHLYLAKYRDSEDFFSDEVASTTTGAKGGYTFRNLKNGRYSLRIYPPGTHNPGELGYEYYDNKWSPYGAKTIIVKGGKVTLKNVVLERTGWFTGKVTDEAGNPVAGTSVMIQDTPTAGGYGFQTKANGTFDSRTGNWTTNLIPGTYHLEASAWTDNIEGPVYASKKVRTTISPAKETKVPQIRLPRLKTAVVTVKDTDGKPLANAPIELFVQRNGGGAFLPPQYGPNETGANGKYRFVGDTTNYKFRVLLPRGYSGTGVPEYWDGGSGAYAYKDAATVSWGSGVPVKQNITVQLGPAPTVKPGTPSVGGKVVVGNTVTAQPGSWTPSSVQHSYEWLKNGSAIGGQSGPKLRITPQIANGLRTLSVRVTGRLSGEKAVDNTSSGERPTLRAVKPKVKGKKRVGKKVTAKPRPAKWKPGKVTFTYQWLRNGKVIKGKKATKKVYRLVKKDRGKRIRVRVTGSKPNHVSVTKVSKRTKKIKKR